MEDIPGTVTTSPLRDYALRNDWVKLPQGVRYTAQWLMDRDTSGSDPIYEYQPHNTDATFSSHPNRHVPMPSGFLLDAAYGAAVLARYSEIVQNNPGQLQNFPRYRARPADDSDHRLARSDSSSLADAADQSDDDLGAHPMWGRFFSVSALFGKKDQVEEEDAIERWLAESSMSADSRRSD